VHVDLDRHQQQVANPQNRDAFHAALTACG
jgi:hypothetical protein